MDMIQGIREGFYVLVVECWVNLDHYTLGEIIVLVGNILLFCGPCGVKKDGSSHSM